MHYLVYRNIYHIEVGVPHDNVALPLLLGIHWMYNLCIIAWGIENGGEEMARSSQTSSIGVYVVHFVPIATNISGEYATTLQC